MKGFLEWFKSNTKMKRWILLILIGIVLACFGISQIIVLKELSFSNVIQIILTFVIGFSLIVIGLIYIQKRTLELLIESNEDSLQKNIKGNISVKSLIFNKNVYANGPKIVVIGGGNGLNMMLQGLKKYTNNITAIVTVSDYGKEASASRRKLDLLPMGDIKQSMVALAKNEENMQNLLEFNLENEEINFGDLFLSVMKNVSGDFTKSIEDIQKVLNITGKILPVTLDEMQICAELQDGTVVKEKDKIPEMVTEKVTKINRIYITPSNCKPAPGVLEAIQEADAIVIGPGSLYTNVIPNLLIKNVAKTIKESKALKFYVTNIMTEEGQTDNYSVSDHINAIIEHAGEDIVNFCICDTGEIVPEYIRKYNKKGQDLVDLDIQKVRAKGIAIVQRDMSTITNEFIRHNPEVISRTIIEIICDDLKLKDKKNNKQYVLLDSMLKNTKKTNKKAKQQKVKKEPVRKTKKQSKFNSKYSERIQSIQTSDDVRKEKLQEEEFKKSLRKENLK